MSDLTPLETAEKLEWIAKIAETDAYICTQDSVPFLKQTASLLRAIAAGEYKWVVYAHWKEVEPGHDVLFECSHCGRIISTSWGSCEDEDTHGNNGCDPTEEWLTCPTCGARMDKEASACTILNT